MILILRCSYGSSSGDASLSLATIEKSEKATYLSGGILWEECARTSISVPAQESV